MNIVDLAKRTQDKDLRLMERYLLRTPFYPAFWVHRRIDRAIASRSGDAHGVLLDLGCGLKPYEKLFARHVDRYFGIEYSPGSGFRGNAADLFADAAAIPLAADSVDTVLCTEVLEHVPDPDKVISEVARVLRPGGIFLCTAPFVYPVHDSYDFFRYSPRGLATIMKRHGLEVEEVVPLSGTGLTLAIMLNLYWYELFMWRKLLYPVGIILRPLLLLLTFVINITGWIFEKIFPSTLMAFDHLTVARQPEHARAGLRELSERETTAHGEHAIYSEPQMQVRAGVVK